MNYVKWIGLLNNIKIRLRMVQLGIMMSKSDLSTDEIIPLIEGLTKMEKIILSSMTPDPIGTRVEVANARIVNKRRNELRSSFKLDCGKEYLLSLPHWSMMIELVDYKPSTDEEFQINDMIRRTANETIFLSDPVVSKMIARIQDDTLSVKQVAAQIEYLYPYEMRAIYSVEEYAYCLDQKVIDVVSAAIEVLHQRNAKRKSSKNNNISYTISQK